LLNGTHKNQRKMQRNLWDGKSEKEVLRNWAQYVQLGQPRDLVRTTQKCSYRFKGSTGIPKSNEGRRSERTLIITSTS